MIDNLIDIDTTVFLWINSWHNLYWDIFMKMASSKLIWIGLYMSILFAIWRTYGWRTTLIMIFAAALTVTFADQITASLLRPIFQRMRPSNLDNPLSIMVHVVDGYRSGRYGFPSCHASNTFAITVLMSMLFKRWRFTLMMILWAVLNCYSRVYLGVHYPGDLLAGSLIGIACGFFVYFLASMCIKGWRLASGPGKIDRLHEGDLNGLRFSYRDIDVPIAVFVLTIFYLFVCAAAFV